LGIQTGTLFDGYREKANIIREKPGRMRAYNRITRFTAGVMTKAI
jgi:hypothetical protein